MILKSCTNAGTDFYTDIINAGRKKSKGFGENMVAHRGRFCYHKEEGSKAHFGAALPGTICQRGVVKMYDEMMDTIGLVGKADPELAAAMGYIHHGSEPVSSYLMHLQS